MKHLKYFENNIQPQVGDYVQCKESTYAGGDDIVKKFILSNIGKIVNIEPDMFPFKIKYVNIPEHLTHRFNDNNRKFSIDEIIRFARPDEIEEYEIKENSEKYNL